jgi:hypothetical protein
MNRKNLLHRLGGVVLAMLLVCVVAGVSSTTANARPFHHGGGFHARIAVGPRFGYGYPYWYGAPYYPYGYGYYSQYYFGSNQSAESDGYNEGFKTGSDDARHDRSYDPERSHYFKDARFGNFAGDYRVGFTRGYSDGFRG